MVIDNIFKFELKLTQFKYQNFHYIILIYYYKIRIILITNLLLDYLKLLS